MRWVFALALSLVCGGGMTTAAQSVSRLYPREKLEADAARWGDQIRAEYRETILPQLTDSERAALSATKIEIPLLGHYGDPFEFYYENGQINLPALSLRFYSDLCVANAWLNGHGYDGTTVRDYVGVLFREAARYPPSPLPPLFRPLGVPDNAREEPAVSNRTDRNFGNTILFLLAHELGQPLKKHNTHSRGPVHKRKKVYVADLKPRKAAFTMPGSEHEPEFNGLFAVRRTAASGAQDTVDLWLLRSGDDQVVGGYMNGKVDGFIQGDIKDGVLKFTWH